VWCGVVWCGVVWCGVVWWGELRARLDKGGVWYSKESERKTGRRPGIIDFRPNLASQFFYLDSGAGHDNVRRAKTQFSLVIVSATFGLGNQQKPYDFKAFLMISGDFSWPTGLAAGRLAVRLEASASRSVSLFRFLRQFFI
jgi:hypothetical protein